MAWIALSFLHFMSCRPNDVCDVSDDERFDCFPDPDSTEQACEARGCCWKPATDALALNVPYCYYGNGNFGYKVCGSHDTPTGFVVDLCLDGPGGQFGNNIKNLTADFCLETNNRLHVKVGTVIILI